LALALNRGDAEQAERLLRALPAGEIAWQQVSDAGALVALAIDGRDGARGGYRSTLERLAARPAAAPDFEPWVLGLLQVFDTFRVLCALREGPWGVAGLNAAIERALAAAGLLQRRGEWYEGRPVLVTRNDPALGVFNGDVGLVLRPPGVAPPGAPMLRAYFADGAALRSVAVGRLADVQTAFATTVHKSQGSEFEHVVLVLPDEDSAVLTRELLYTGVTRARRAFTLACAGLEPLVRASARLTRRYGGLARMLRR